jgi:hypothetical protein
LIDGLFTFPCGLGELEELSNFALDFCALAFTQSACGMLIFREKQLGIFEGGGPSAGARWLSP